MYELAKRAGYKRASTGQLYRRLKRPMYHTHLERLLAAVETVVIFPATGIAAQLRIHGATTVVRMLKGKQLLDLLAALREKQKEVQS